MMRNEASRELMLHSIVLQNDQSPDWQGAVSSLETGIMLIFEKRIKFSVSSFTINSHRLASFDECDDLLQINRRQAAPIRVFGKCSNWDGK